MPTKYLEGKVDIAPQSGDTYPFSFSAPGGDVRGTLRLPTDEPMFQELLRRLSTPDTDDELPIQIGSRLFDALFQGTARAVYNRTQKLLQAGEVLRLNLTIDASAAEVAALPWEFLSDPDQEPLALLDISIVRYFPQQAPIPALPVALPLKVLITAALTPPEHHVERELAEVRAAIADLEAQGRVTVQVEEHLTVTILQRWLREGFHIWHFIGHGADSRDGRSGTLVFEDGAGSSKAVSASELNIILNRSGVLLIALDTCNSTNLATDPYRTIGPALVRAQIPAVVAMQFTLPQETTRAFTGEFYHALAEGLPIDACVTEGRKAVMSKIGLRNPDWGSPVVYTRAADGELFKPPSIAAPPTVQGSGVNVSVAGNIPKGATDKEHSEQLENMRQPIEANRRRLRELQLRAARRGSVADPRIALEIEDLSAEIARLQHQLASTQERNIEHPSTSTESDQPITKAPVVLGMDESAEAEPPAVPKSPVGVQQRRLEAAMPRSAHVDRPTEIRVMIALPPSEGLRRFLPAVTESGDIIRRDDVAGHEVVVEFENEQWTTLYLELAAPDFEVEQPVKPLRVPRASDSGVATFFVTPRRARADGRAVVNLYQDAERQTLLDSLTLMVDIKGRSIGMFFEEVWQIVTSSVSGTRGQSLVATGVAQQVVYVNVRNQTVIHGDQYNLTGNFQGSNVNIKSNLSNASQSVGTLVNANQADKDELLRLLQQLNAELQEAPAAQQAETEALSVLARRLLDAATQAPINQTTVQIATDGLHQATGQLASTLPAVAPIVEAMIAHIGRMVSTSAG